MLPEPSFYKEQYIDCGGQQSSPDREIKIFLEGKDICAVSCRGYAVPVDEIFIGVVFLWLEAVEMAVR